MEFTPLLSGLNETEKEAFLAITKEASFSRGEMVLDEGRQAKGMYYLLAGAFRSFFYKNGVDMTDFFFFEQNYATDFASLYSGKPSLLKLEAIEDTKALYIPREPLLKLSQSYPIFAYYGRISAEYAFLIMEERARLLHTENLETKYKWMMDRFPFIFQRVPQYYIASYLGVKPESLSRIKKKIGTSL